MITREQYINTSHTTRADADRAHREYYGQFVSSGVVGLVARRIGIDEIRASKDPHFNDIPLSRWDALHHDIIYIAGPEIKKAAGGVGLLETVCVAKVAAQGIREGRWPAQLLSQI